LGKRFIPSNSNKIAKRELCTILLEAFNFFRFLLWRKGFVELVKENGPCYGSIGRTKLFGPKQFVVSVSTALEEMQMLKFTDTNSK
jgi:hypothetical protein